MYRHQTRRGHGSSPRLRGTLFSGIHTFPRWRFIPALAGNICRQRTRTRVLPVHPRACGEHDPVTSTAPGINGSSPRLRGTSGGTTTTPVFYRFIPALAGNICCWKKNPTSCSVHPRACGEHVFQQRICVAFGGSSPRLRGTFCISVNKRPVDRFIPALAGNILPLLH